MLLSDFDYNLPKELIAQGPAKPRDHSRLLVLEKENGNIEHKHFYNIVDYLQKGDVLVLNNSKVFPARLIGSKKETGGKIEVFLLHKKNNPPTPLIKGIVKGDVWQCLVGGKGKKNLLEIELKGMKARLLKNNEDGTWDVWFDKTGRKLMDIVHKIGQTPLPPYIKREPEKSLKQDVKTYQTIYADEKKIGSVAVPTAGLHFTKELVQKLKKKGVIFEYVTLHVGLGTFAPVKTDNILEHKMHSEWVEIKKKTIEKIIKAKKEKRRVIAVGTTSVRSLETYFSSSEKEIKDWRGWTSIFIYPGHNFKVLDVMITNFHLPKSTLLMLISAFVGTDNMKKAYEIAVKEKYRFFSYGDAMFIY